MMISERKGKAESNPVTMGGFGKIRRSLVKV